MKRQGTAGAITARRSAKNERRAGLRALSLELQGLHRELMGISRDRYEHANGPVASRAEVFELLLHDETFAWLRSLSGLIVEIDELAAGDGAVTEAEARAMVARVRALISPSGDPDAFGTRYIALLASEPRVAMSHVGLRGALGELVEPEESEPEREWQA